MEDTAQEQNVKKCMNCIFFEERTGFCRKNPPAPITIQDHGKTFITPAFPKIQMPNLDWCFEFVDKKQDAIQE